MDNTTQEWVTLTTSYIGNTQVTTEAMNAGENVIVKNTTMFTNTSDPVCISESMTVVPNTNVVEEYDSYVLRNYSDNID